MTASCRIAAIALVATVACPGMVGLAHAQAKKSDSVVKIKTAAGTPGADGLTPVVISLTIEKGWHLYANPVGLEDFADNATTVSVTGAKADVTYPPGKAINDKTLGTYKVYEDTVKIIAKTKRAAGGGPIELNIKLQACNDTKCLLPAIVKVPVD